MWGRGGVYGFSGSAKVFGSREDYHGAQWPRVYSIIRSLP